MNTGYIDLLTGLARSLARPPAKCCSSTLLTCHAEAQGGSGGSEESRRGGRGSSGRQRAQVTAEASSSLDPSFPTKLEGDEGSEAWMMLCGPVPVGRRFVAGRS